MPRSKSSDTFKSRKEVASIMTETDSFFHTFESKKNYKTLCFGYFIYKINSSLYRADTNLPLLEDTVHGFGEFHSAMIMKRTRENNSQGFSVLNQCIQLFVVVFFSHFSWTAISVTCEDDAWGLKEREVHSAYKTLWRKRRRKNKRDRQELKTSSSRFCASTTRSWTQRMWQFRRS